MSFVRRLMASVITLCGVCTITFALVFVVPSDPARTLAGPKADAETLDRIRIEMGLDRPVVEQYFAYCGRLLYGDLGRSYVTREPIARAIAVRLPATLLLAVAGLGVSVILGVLGGCVTATHAGSRLDLAVLVASVSVLSLPVFWVGMLLLYVVTFRLGVLPIGGFGGLRSVILPACALGLGGAAYYARLVHSSMENVLAEDYIRTARAKGLSSWQVYGRHALRNALIPITTVIGIDFAGLMSGVVLTETVFNWPGIGRLAVEAVFREDIPMIMGTVLFSAAVVILVNIAVDGLYVLIDPRLRGEG